MAGRADDIEVVVLRAGGSDDAGAGGDGRPPVGRRRRRWGASLAALAVVVATVAAPVARGRPAQEAASPAMPATDLDRCPGLETRRLWCAFVTDGGCCPLAGGQQDPPPSRSHLD